MFTTKNKDKPLILINRYNYDSVSTSSPKYKSKLNRQIHYVSELPPRRYITNSESKTNNKIKSNTHKRSYSSRKSQPLANKSKMHLKHSFIPITECKSHFPIYYDNCLIPCHIKHNISSVSLIWDKPFDEIDYSKVLTICFEGLIETKRPYSFISSQACKELLLANNTFHKVLPLLGILYKYFLCIF